MQSFLQPLVYLGSLFISTYGLFAEVPVTGEWAFKTERLEDGTVFYRPVTLQANPKDEDHLHCLGFSYNESTGYGPSQWGNICLQWAACNGNGGRQSPVDIVTSRTVRKATGGLVENYMPQWNTTVINEAEVLNMYGVLLDRHNYIEGGPLDDQYQLLSFHYHIPSEHTIDGVRYPLELHLVHQSLHKDPPALAVVGLMFEKSDEFNSTSLSQFITALHSFDDLTIPHISTNVLLTLHREIFPADKEKTFFNYKGSLTTPPCAEIVNWLVMETPIIAGTKQIEYLASLIGDPKGDNSRPVQPLNDRSIIHFNVPASSHPASLPPGGVAVIVLLLIFVLGGAFVYCAFSINKKDHRIIFCGKLTDYEFLGYTKPPFVRKLAGGSINSGPASDEQEEEEEEEEEEEPKPKGKPKAVRKGKGEIEDEEEEHETRGGGGGRGVKKISAEEEEDEDVERAPRGGKQHGKKSGTYATAGGDDEDFDAPSSKKTGRSH